jgi:hypothetical protein
MASGSTLYATWLMRGTDPITYDAFGRLYSTSCSTQGDFKIRGTCKLFRLKIRLDALVPVIMLLLRVKRKPTKVFPIGSRKSRALRRPRRAEALLTKDLQVRIAYFRVRQHLQRVITVPCINQI